MVCSHAPIDLQATKLLGPESTPILLPTPNNPNPQTVFSTPPSVPHAPHAPIYSAAATTALTARLIHLSQRPPEAVTPLDLPQGRPDATDNGGPVDTSDA